jgi:mitochondrial import receptor subunit TOM70
MSNLAAIKPPGNSSLDNASSTPGVLPSQSSWDRISKWISENRVIVYTIAGVAVVVTGGVVYYITNSRKEKKQAEERRVSKKERRRAKREKEQAEAAKEAAQSQEGEAGGYRTVFLGVIH